MVKITIEEWDYTCTDGCCTDYGATIYLNGKELPHPNPEIIHNGYVGMDVGLSIEAVLKELGYEVEIENTYKND
ncbi:hypothetical protein [Flavobacterium sp.]|uniref:hypothetical protein n=1 Tax=Flavobacterium sp. TaxID=239 RepID=UPI0025E03186|nr:hypothetical protein [Flavobacterium sp.]